MIFNRDHVEQITWSWAFNFFLGTIKVIANKDREMSADYLECLHCRAAFSSTNLQQSFLSEALSKPPPAAVRIRNETNLLVGPKFD